MYTKKTKDKIIYTALCLFSERGYNAVGVEEIARGVGIRAPSIYKHFKNKQAIFDEIVKLMRSKNHAYMDAIHITFANAEAAAHRFSSVSDEEFVDKIKRFVRFYLHDEYMGKFRRLVLMECYNMPEFADYYTHFADKIVDYFDGLFDCLIKNGTLRSGDSKVMALQFIAPIRCIMTMCEFHPEREADAMLMLADHVRQFRRFYGN